MHICIIKSTVGLSMHFVVSSVIFVYGPMVNQPYNVSKVGTQEDGACLTRNSLFTLFLKTSKYIDRETR